MNEHQPNYKRSTVSHLQEFIDPTKAKRIVDKCVQLLKKSELQFTTIAFRGLSGSLIAPAIAMRMGKTLLAVRKVSTTHGSYPVEGDYNAKNYIIVDDFISSGATCREIMEQVAKHRPQAKCVAVLQAYYFDHKSFAQHNGWPEILCTRFVDRWNEGEGVRRKAEAERIKAQREAEQLVRDEQIQKLLAPPQSMEEIIWNYEKLEDISMEEVLGRALLRMNRGLHAFAGLPKQLPPVQTQKERLSRLAQDRANFNARTATGRQRFFPKITSSSLRSISR